MNKIGKFYIKSDIIKNPETAMALSYIKFVPIRVEYLYEKMAFEMIGFSYIFQELDPHLITPNYEIVIETVGMGKIVNAHTRETEGGHLIFEYQESK